MPGYYRKNSMFEVEESLHINFNDKNLLQQALTHKSFVNENKSLGLRDNERLEFLGDSVLSLTVSTYIFKKFPDYPEGKLAKMRATVVSAPVLAAKARELDIGSYLLLGRGEEMTGGRERDSILADTMEAVLGAIYLDKDFNRAATFINDLLREDINAVERGDHIQDYKTLLQEVIQKNNPTGPEYEVIEEQGPDHNKVFTVRVRLQDRKLGTGKGTSKKEAEQKAAEIALENLGEM